MIDSRKLEKIGSFKNFPAEKANECSFSVVNVFYGYNGSGKTTLTRVFSCLNDGVQALFDNDGELLADFTGGKIDIQCNQESITDFSATNIKGKIKVFNTDFIEKNLKFEVGKANKLSAVIGEHNIALKKEIMELEKQKAELYTPKKTLKAQDEADHAKTMTDEVKRNVATEIRGCLNIANANSYNIGHFKEDLRKYVPPATPLTEADKRAAGDIYSAQEKAEIDSKHGVSLDNLNSMLALENYTRIFDLLKTAIKRNAAQIKEEVIKWIEEGAALHTDDHDTCKFCGQSISSEIWSARSAKMQELIKKDDKYAELEKQLSAEKSTITGYREQFKSFTLGLEEIHFFTKELFAGYQNSRTVFDTALADFSDAIKELTTAIDEKNKNKDTAKPFDNAEDFKNKAVKLSAAISNLKNTINANNREVGKINELRESNKKTVIDFYIQQNKAKIQEEEANEQKQKALLEKAQQDVQKFEKDIHDKNASLENQEENIKRLNEFLEQMLDVGLEFKIKPGSSEYLLERQISGMPNTPAKNLSEGEKNIIAFLYFLVSLDSSSKEGKKEEIIVIDDPVSSLDSNNLFILQNLIIKTLKSYGQQFFLTHNFYFFAKVRESLRANSKENIRIFEIKSNKETGSFIKEACKYTQKHISDYMSIMDALRDKWVSSSADDEKDVTTGNLIRRVLEVFLGFKDTHKDHSLFFKLQTMAGDDIKYQSLLNMCNAFSHAAVGENADFSYAAGKKEIEVLFNFMDKIDPDHFKGFEIKL